MAADATAALAQLLEPHGVLAWLATYLVHSTLLLGAAWLVSRRLRGRSLAVEERLWKAALVGGLLTATLQTGLAALPAPQAEASPARVVVTAALPATWSPASPEPAETALPMTPHPRLGGLAAALPGWQRLALTGWIGGCLLLVGGLAFCWLRLRLRLRGREDLAAGPAGRLLELILARTATRRPVRLTGSATLPVPVALGVGEREICLPERALRELDHRHQEGLLAHELAHLERRDPAWLLGALVVQSVFFFQPLNRLARRRLEEISELRCDEWAVRATGDRVGLARCLTEVASWLVAAPSALPAPGMARRQGGLSDRVHRILEGGADEEATAARRRWLPAAAAAGLLAGVLLVPGLAPATFADPEPADQAPATTEPATPPAETAETADRGEPSGASADAPIETGAGADLPGKRDLAASQVPDSEEISRLVEMAVAAARASLPDPAEMAEIQRQAREAVREAMAARREVTVAQREAMAEARRALESELAALGEEGELSAAERARLRAEVEREVAAAHREVERALAAARPELEELERLNLYIERDLAEELARARRELERVNRELRAAGRRMERERRGIHEERREELELRHQELRKLREELREEQEPRREP